MEKLYLSAEQWQAMRRHVEACAPREGCGLLLGTNGKVREVIRVTNVERSTVRFRMAPEEQLAAFQRMEETGMEMLAIYHSHPAGPDTPSATDVREAAYPVVYIIWSFRGGQWRARGFRIEGEEVREVKLVVGEKR